MNTHSDFSLLKRQILPNCLQGSYKDTVEDKSSIRHIPTISTNQPANLLPLGLHMESRKS